MMACSDHGGAARRRVPVRRRDRQDARWLLAIAEPGAMDNLAARRDLTSRLSRPRRDYGRTGVTDTGPSAHADTLTGEELAGTAHLTVEGERRPRVGEVLLVDEVAEPAECTVTMDRLFQSLS